MGIGLAVPGFHARAYVEWEQHPRDTLVAAMRAGYLAHAPIWDDLTTFGARPLAGAIDTLLAGYPCQPFSAAGQRKGADDERHLWPHVARVARELGDGLRWIILENVAGHVSLGLEAVLRELWDMGFTPAAGLFTAAEVGAPHKRERIFIVAYRDNQEQCPDGLQSDTGSDGRNDTGRGGGAALGDTGPDADARRLEPGANRGSAGDRETDREERQRLWDRSGGAVDDVDHTAGARRDDARCGPDANSGGGQRLSGAGCDELADTGQPGPQGREQPGSPDERHGSPAHGSVAQLRRPFLFPPGPTDRDAWGITILGAPGLAPSIDRRGAVQAAAHGLATLLAADAAEGVQPGAGGMEGAGELATLGRQTREALDRAASQSSFCRTSYGVTSRSRALRLLGNGVCPLVAGYAFRTLAAAHGLRPVDLDAAGPDWPGTGPDESALMEDCG